MSNDSGIRRKHKQRTVVHKKHSVFPGISLSSQVTADKGSIRNIRKPVLPNFAVAKEKRNTHALWETYDAVCVKLRDSVINASSAPLAGRNNVEDKFVNAYRSIVKAGLAQKLKRKYTLR